MCGICGIVWTDTQHPVDGSLLRRMNDTLAHRGPDAEGLLVDNNVGLGDRRLKIIDLATGDQPIANEDHSSWIVFNGEIYNYLALREELAQRGHTFRTQSDTETILHAYDTWGVECLARLRGMFAFAIWDDRRKTLFLARDRLGKKPLYFFHTPEQLSFGSEIKAILEDHAIPRQVDLTALDQYLTYGYIPSERTGFEGIKKLRPGHFLLWQDGRIETRSYWHPTFAPTENRTEEEWCALLLDKLRECVRLRLVSDVPLGAFLSGGIDSSTIVALMSQLTESPVKTFSIDFQDQGFSEVEHARKVAARYQTEHHEFIVRPDPVDILPKLALQFDEPFADSSAIPTYYVSKMAREHVTVILSGDGGDELFAGYRSYAEALAAQARPQPLRVLARSLSNLLPAGMAGKNYLAWQSLDGRERFLAGNRIFETGVKQQLYTEKMPDTNAANIQACLMDQPLDGLVTRMQSVDLQTYLPDDILAKVDRASMLCSLEVRCPFLDHELVEFIGTMPAALKMRGNIQKYILKRSVQSLLPTEILARGKKGFSVPLARWLREELSEAVNDSLMDAHAIQRGLFKRSVIEKLIQEHREQRRDHSRRLWALLMLELWQRNYVDGR